MNSLFALGNGKILVAGDVKPAASLFRIPMPPMISSEPSVEGFTRAIESIFQNSGSFERYPEEAIQYVKDHHSPKLIAQKFINVFNL